MLNFRNAIQAIQSALFEHTLSKTSTRPLEYALGAILAEDIHSPVNVPPADNSAMDGYVLATQDLTQAPFSLPISQRIPAGKAAEPLVPGTAARIFTGAEIPLNADAVVMQENCDTEDEGFITVRQDPKINENIRPQGQDIEKGTCVLSRGHKLKAEDLGLLASIGLLEVLCYCQLKVAILSTGNELIPLGRPLEKGQIYDSNRPMISALCQTLGCEIVYSGHIEDSEVATLKSLKELSQVADVVISGGGVSVGEEDHVKSAVEQLGKLEFWKVNMKPGKPFAFGTLYSDNPETRCTFIGLPGNPVSAFVTFHLFAQAALRQLQGEQDFHLPNFYTHAGFSTQKIGTRDEFIRVKIDNHYAHRYKNQSSGVLSSVSWGNALALIPANTTIDENTLIEVFPY